nr:MAG TPA: hypothetical protein [Caudoviricetes sp.]
MLSECRLSKYKDMKYIVMSANCVGKIAIFAIY